jgi:hypothetical protein
MAGPASLAWTDALSGSMNQKNRAQYQQFGEVPGQNPILSGIRQLLNETLLMPQNATNAWIGAFGPPPGTASFLPQKPTIPTPGPQMPSGAAIPGSTPFNPATPVPTRLPVQRPDRAMSIPLAQPPDYLTMVGGLEGTGKNKHSTAVGPGQFTDGTFNDYLRSTGKVLGQNGVPADLTAAKQSYGMDATQWYKEQNTKELAKAGIPVDNTTLYGAHFLGPGGLKTIWQADPNTPVAQLLDPDAISGNATILAGKTAGQVKAWLQNVTSGNVLPSPPTLGAPPQMSPVGAPPQQTEMGAPPALKSTGPIDFSQANAFADKGKPKPFDQDSYDSLALSNVLGGLAGGAAKVDVTKPGAVAAVLANMGAGGMAGRSEATAAQLQGQDRKDAQEQNYNMSRSGMATTQATAQHQNEEQQNQVAFQNAKATWETMRANQQIQFQNQQATYGAANTNRQTEFQNQKSVYDTANANKQTQYEGDLKERTARMPQVTSDTNGFLIKQYNPSTQSMDIKYTPTKDIFANAEKTSEMIKSLGAPGPASEALLAQHLMSTIKDPTLAQAVLEKEAVKRTLANGGGATVFGKAYEAAYKQAESQVPAAMQKDPTEYQKAVHDIAASNIYNALAKKGDRSWLKAAAANGSIIAGILSGPGTE